MKDKLNEKYFSESYRHGLLDELYHFRQGSMSVQAYTIAFDDHTLRCELREDPHQTIFRFLFWIEDQYSVRHDHLFPNYKDPCTG